MKNYGLLLGMVGGLGLSGCSQLQKIPVIYDTDIGADIDDTWALALILASPELDLKLVVTDSHNTEGKTRIVAKFLERVGRTDVPVGTGIKFDDRVDAQAPWVEDYDLSKYAGTIHADGVQAMIDTIMDYPRPPITLLAVGPVPNLAEALRREPRITQRARLVVMGGTIQKDYHGDPEPAGRGDYNVAEYPQAAQVAYTADWDLTMAPMNTAATVYLSGEPYARVRDADNPMAQALMENYRIWAVTAAAVGDPYDTNLRSSTLFDTVAVYLTWDNAFCKMEDVRFRVTNNGYTLPDPQGKLAHAALEWADREAFYELLADRIANYRR